MAGLVWVGWSSVFTPCLLPWGYLSVDEFDQRDAFNYYCY